MLLFALLCYSGAAMAQNVTITGRVVDQTDTPIMMANVLEAGLTIFKFRTLSYIVYW